MLQLSDSHILSTAQTNRTKALELAFDLYWDVLFRHAFRKLQSEDIAKDTVQDVFIVMWENMEKLNLGDELLPYLYGVLRNKILTQFKRDSVRLRYAVKVANKGEALEPSSHQLLLHKELKTVIDDEVARMPIKMKEIYFLKKEDNRSIKEIAEQLDLSEQTIKNQLQNAANRLKLRIGNYDPSLLKIGMIISGVELLSRLK